MLFDLVFVVDLGVEDGFGFGGDGSFLFEFESLSFKFGGFLFGC